ncbi:hypothetical protein V6X62_06790 [Spiribacter sp. 218]|uniref:hypothetical protein n=1 Tax=Spiribacter pallidus TaxID=1987936 RepID=UPI00349FAA0F
MGLLAGLLGWASLPPIGLDGLGLVWLVPWFIALRFPIKQRCLHTALAAGLPALHVILGIVEAYPAMAFVALALALGPMMTGALIGLASHRFWGVRCGLIIVTVALAMGGLRYLGLPVSVAAVTGLPGPSGIRQPLAEVLAGSGVITLDVALIGAQAAMAAALCRSGAHSHRLQRLARWSSASGLLLAIIVLTTTNTGESAEPTAKRVAVIETALPPHQKARLIADNQLETVVARHRRLRQQALQADPDWIVWPEGSTPGLGSPPPRPDPARPVSDPPAEIRHVYRYQRPGQLSSTAVLRTVRGQPIAQIDKRRPLPIAESSIADPRQSSAATMLGATPVTVLICSDIFHTPSLFDVARSDTAVIINPTSIGYLGGRWLPLLHQRAVQIQAAALGRPVVVPTNGSAAFWVSATGALNRLGAGTGAQPHIATLPVPRQTHAPHPLLGVGIWVAFVSLPAASAGTVSHRLPAPRWRPGCRPTVTIGVLALIAFRLVIEHQPSSTPSKTPDDGTASLSYEAITAPEQPDSAVVAALARSFAIPITVADIPADRDHAWRWLCQQIHMGLDPSPVPLIEPPALGIVTANEGPLVIRWSQGGRPIAFDPVAGVFQILERPPPDTLWLREMPPHRACSGSAEW